MSFIPRDCVKIIQQMLDKIPVEEETEELINALKVNQKDASYKAPEETIQWQKTSNTLKDYIPIPKKEWEFEILSIFTTVPIEVIKEQVKSILN